MITKQTGVTCNNKEERKGIDVVIHPRGCRFNDIFECQPNEASYHRSPMGHLTCCVTLLMCTKKKVE